MKQKLNWTKLPSVTRPGKFFYRAIIQGRAVTLSQSFLTGRWMLESGFTELGDFQTFAQAQDFAEKNLTA